MNTAQIEELIEKLVKVGFKKRKLSALSVPTIFSELEHMPELFPFCDKPGTSGVLIFVDRNVAKAAHYELKKLKASKSGALKPIVCDFCYTQRPGAQIALITFNLNREKTKSVAHYACADLACSLHVRGLTDALTLAKTQVSEDITIEGRIERLQRKSGFIFGHNGAKVL